MSKTMQALVKKEAGAGLSLEEVTRPEVGVNDVLIKVEKTSICGTDLHIYQWNEWAKSTIKTPLIIGHEFMGAIAELGKNVHDFKIGDIVSGEGHLVCGRCRNCLAGRRHLCMNTCGIGINRNGAFAQYLSIPVTNVWYCDSSIPKDIISCFDPLGNATHTALSFDLLGEDVLITGAGPIGLFAVAIAKHAGARYIVITDINPYRLEIARQLGATRTVDVRKEKLSPIAQELGMKEGFDVGLEMSGNPEALRSMLANLCHGGKIAQLGILPANTSIDWNQVVFNGITIKGIYGREMYETWYKMTSMLQTGLEIAPVITHNFPYQSFAEGFAVMISGKAGKVILDW